jgi:hypothetical protein
MDYKQMQQETGRVCNSLLSLETACTAQITSNKANTFRTEDLILDLEQWTLTLETLEEARFKLEAIL